MSSETTPLFSTNISNFSGNTSSTFRPDPYTNPNYHKTKALIPTLIPQPFELTLLNSRLLNATKTTARTQTSNQQPQYQHQLQTKITIQSEFSALLFNSTTAQQTIALLLRCILCFATPVIILSWFSSLDELCSGSLALVAANVAYFAVIQGCVSSIPGSRLAGMTLIERPVDNGEIDNDGMKVGFLFLNRFGTTMIMLIPMISICWFFEIFMDSLFELPLLSSSSLSWLFEGLFHGVQSYSRVLSLGLPGLVVFELCDLVLSLVYHQQFVTLSLSFWIMGLCVLAYVLVFVDGSYSWKEFTKKAMSSGTDLLKQLSLAVNSVIAVEIEYCVFELMILTTLFFGKVQFAVLTLCSVIASLIVQIFYAFGCAVSIRVSQLISLGDKSGSAKSARYCMIFTEILGVFNFFLLSIFKKPIVSVFTNDEELTHESHRALPYVFALQLFDSLNFTCVSLFRSQRRQVIGSVVHVATYFMIGLPLTYCLAFVLQYKVIGLWIGLNLTAFLLISFEVPLVLITDWAKAIRIASRSEDELHNWAY
ncbi:unnamed protein product [Ambrosiozyma monospora]|uniref:Unnamed protein product n=1 Tax=Ambrosiozyma monospora TaxID=43982 RepID=A0ACB5SUI5_AMBMO|nr:unnamed protein product [Ambrosiozyma monospora]